MPAEWRELQTRLCILEYHPWTGTTDVVKLERRPGADPAQLWLDRRGLLDPMTIGIAEYVERSIETRGAFGWHVLFCEWRDQPDRKLFELAVDRRQFEDLQRLFPHVDYGTYLTRYDQMWSSMR